MGAPAPPPTGLAFAVSVDVRRDQQPHSGTRIDAHVRVKATGTGPRDRRPAVELAVVIALDVAPARRREAAAALAAALRALPDGLSFAVLGGTGGTGDDPGDGTPARCYPLRGDWALADGDEKRRAAFSAGRVAPTPDDEPPPGYGAWLAAARALFAVRPLPVRQLILVTDGGGHDPADEPDREDSALRAGIAACEGEFGVVVLALGRDWDPAPLLALAEGLHGTAEPAPDRFAPAVTGALRQLRRVRSPELPVTVTGRPTVTEVALSESLPEWHSLVPVTEPGHPHRYAFATHRWTPGARDYLLTLRADASTDPLGVLLQLATVSVGDATAPLVVRWLPPGVAVGADSGGGGGTVDAVNAATRMRTALDRGYAALDPMSRDEAERQFGLAVRLAHEIGAAWVLDDVRKVADIVDGARGRVRVGPTVDRGTVREGRLHVASGRALDLPAHPAPPPVKCPGCRHPAGQGARYCIACGRSL
ncbi:von Willebrand factor type A domain-containing protein [Streptomyces sp. KhCrAH-43]|uniref:hypothetical protein n=1 Tax=unclassified Streptomyces TaxID=2593676 RepID=UPI0003705E68|nr:MULTISPECIES: hypothetical protein [unclassified Streptomyces]MYS37752.1 hypothetical protein [Streptomyces sp. SID4920]MYX65939.1 hypothetical protein [Streptomyces sp. SID8373]RAJ67419.1 von Willebrand factor type A domain-containing protein [Streptomyces sp. KhCrAH-43]